MLWNKVNTPYIIKYGSFLNKLHFNFQIPGTFRVSGTEWTFAATSGCILDAFFNIGSADIRIARRALQREAMVSR